MVSNQLGREVHEEDIANALDSLAMARETTGAVLTIDRGNITTAMR